MSDLATIIGNTTEEIFELAGGFDFTDELAVALNVKRLEAKGPLVVSQIDLAWLLDGYARARLSEVVSVPDGKVLVDEADLRALAEWGACGIWLPCPGIGTEGDRLVQRQANDAIVRLVAALPEPEWEPSDELVEQVAEAAREMFLAQIPGRLSWRELDDDSRARWKLELACHLKAFRAAGLLRDDL